MYIQHGNTDFNRAAIFTTGSGRRRSLLPHIDQINCMITFAVFHKKEYWKTKYGMVLFATKWFKHLSFRMIHTS